MENKTYVSSAGVGVNSMFPSGVAAPSSGITVLGTLSNGNEITLISDGTINFGSVQPDLCCYSNLKNAAAIGGDFELVEGSTIKSGYVIGAGVTYKTPSNRIKLLASSDFPDGKAMVIGCQETVLKGAQAGGDPDFSTLATYGQIEAIATKRKSNVMFMTYTFQWPAAEQQNMMENSVENEQVKLFWYHNGFTGFNGYSTTPGQNDVFNSWVGIPSGSGGGTFAGAGYTINSSTSVSLSISGNTSHHFIDSNDIGKTVVLSALSSVGNAGSAVIASVSGTTVNLTVSGWPSSGSGTLNCLKRGTMQAENRVIRANESATIADQNTQYHFTKQGTIPDPYTVDSTHQNPHLCIHQVWMNTALPDVWVWCRLIDTVTGEIYNYYESHVRPVTMSPTRDSFEYLRFPGHVQGVNIYPISGNPNSSTGKGISIGDFVIQYGNCARVEMVDASDNGVGVKKLAHFPITYLSPYIVKCIYLDSVFSGAPATGNTIQFIGADNIKKAGKTI